jgi:hypothetical protein
VTDADLGRWEPYGVDTVRDLMAGAAMTWWLSGGEALDVFVGRRTRDHGDVDVSVRRADLDRLRSHLAGRLELRVAHGGKLRELGDGPLAETEHGLWARERRGGPWRLQFNLEPVVGDEWVYRRDARIRLPIDRLIRWRGDLPYVAPAVQLLWKAKDTRPDDQHDFDTVVPRLAADERRWLADAIALAHPTSPWAAALTRA